ncbi:MAG: hypothetical protein AB1405_10690 [Bdellovibrionota bacterium]
MAALIPGKSFGEEPGTIAKRKVTFSLRVGVQIPTQPVDEAGETFVTSIVGQPAEAKGDAGFRAGGTVAIDLSQRTSLGLALEWSRMGLTAPGTNLGDMNTFTALPYILFHPKGRSEKRTYYLTGGLGAHLNWLHFAHPEDCVWGAASGCNAKPYAAVAFRVGAGGEAAISPKTRLSLELNWTLNMGSLEGDIDGIPLPKDGLNLSAVMFLAGVRFEP